MELLKADQIASGYHRGFRIEGIDISCTKGTFNGIIGPNGSGKSTLFKTLTGELPLLQGSILFEGQNIYAMSRRERACSMAVVSQFAELSPITVEEYVMMGRLPYRKPFQFFSPKEDLKIARRVMELTQIDRLRHRIVTELSGGEQQMASIACALAQCPKLLFLDEPTSHLDISHQIRIMNLLQELNKERELTVVMILHDLNLASEYCHHLSLMHRGRIYRQGTPQEVLTYTHIEEVYDTVVVVRNNPISDKPVIFPVSGNMTGKRDSYKTQSI